MISRAPLRWVLFPGDVENGVLCFLVGFLIALSKQFDRESFRLHFDTSHMGID
jgi:hypothetical protein